MPTGRIYKLKVSVGYLVVGRVGVVSEGTVRDGQMVSTGEPGSGDEQAEIKLIKKMEDSAYRRAERR